MQRWGKGVGKLGWNTAVKLGLMGIRGRENIPGESQIRVERANGEHGTGVPNIRLPRTVRRSFCLHALDASQLLRVSASRAWRLLFPGRTQGFQNH